MGHTGLALVELVGYGFTWLVIIVAFLGALRDNGPAGAAVAAAIFFVVLLFEHVVDASLTYFIAKKGLVPKGH